MRFHRAPFAIGVLALLASSATSKLEAAPTSNLLSPAGNYGVEIVAENPRQWTGLTVSADGRFFVNFPRWSDDVPVSVAELDPRTGKLTPYPDTAWNAYAQGVTPQDQFVCVQSVAADDRGLLWRSMPEIPNSPESVKMNRETWIHRRPRARTKPRRLLMAPFPISPFPGE